MLTRISLCALALVLTLGAHIPHTEAIETTCPTFRPGDLVRTAEDPGLHLINDDGDRMEFLSKSIYDTWYDSFDGTIVVDEACLDALNHGGPVPYKAGSLVTFTHTPEVFVIEDNNELVHIPDEAAAVSYAGEEWTAQVHVLSEAYAPYYIRSQEAFEDLDATPSEPTAAEETALLDIITLFGVEEEAIEQVQKSNALLPAPTLIDDKKLEALSIVHESIVAESNTKSAMFEGMIEVVESDTNFSGDISFSGFVNDLNPERPQMKALLDLDLMGDTGAFTGSVKYLKTDKENDYFGFFDIVPWEAAEDIEFDIASFVSDLLNDKWLHVSSTPDVQTMATLSDCACDEQLRTLLAETMPLRVTDIYEETVIDGHDVYHYGLGINNHNLEDYLRTWSNTMLLEDGLAVEDPLDTFLSESMGATEKARNIEVWIDKETYQLHRVAFDFEPDVQSTMHIDINLSDFNEEMDEVLAPEEGIVTMEELIEELFAELFKGLEDLEFDAEFDVETDETEILFDNCVTDEAGVCIE